MASEGGSTSRASTRAGEVPEFERLVKGAGDEGLAVRREGHAVHAVCMPFISCISIKILIRKYLKNNNKKRRAGDGIGRVRKSGREEINDP